MSEPVGLGLDVGSVSIAAVLADQHGRIIRKSYVFHKGKVNQCLVDILESWKDEIHAVALTGSCSTGLSGISEYDELLCVMRAASLFQNSGSLFWVGGERFHLIRFHEDGSYRDTRSNTSCAAGTGSFLDQQAMRLGLSDSGKLAETAESNRGAVPKIAARCSVFAKTDLIHAQQEGYSLEGICDGLASGVAKNLIDTLLGSRKLPSPSYLAGGVAKNPAVLRHLCNMTGSSIRVAPDPEYLGAVGAAMMALEEQGKNTGKSRNIRPFELVGQLRKSKESRIYRHERLELDDVTGQSGIELFRGEKARENNPVEMEYGPVNPGEQPVHLGIDIGSTSTKAVLVTEEGAVLSGFYTRTSGRPVDAIQAIFESMQYLEKKKNCRFRVLTASTTGSGRKMIGKLIGADLVLDEITAHAGAAVEIDPEVDTIIEIGGQDAKFTTLRNKIVTFSHMNTVCAAGTGSFIEEQAARLGVALTDIASLAASAKAPETSNRCTVFMERDINHLLTRGYSTEEILAAVMHSVVENYLHKVATPGLIGERICFQGATARNRALVAAFKAKLKKNITVSQYCHLAGALGTALTARDEIYLPGKKEVSGDLAEWKSSFRGLEFHKEKVAVRTEVCRLCANSCKLTITKTGGEVLAWGFLCGRDYGAKKKIDNNIRGAYNGAEIRSRKYAVEWESSPPMPERERDAVIGIPYALHLVDDAGFWCRFFGELGVRVQVGRIKSGIDGRKFARAEFCAPMVELHGQVERLLHQTDYVFVPHSLNNVSRSDDADYPGYPPGAMCYYTQFAPTVLSSAFDAKDRIISPLVGGPGGIKSLKSELTEILEPVFDADYREISEAYDRAVRYDLGVRRSITESYIYRAKKRKDIEVVLLGRPYTLLSERMNRGIPRIFSSLGVNVTLQDEIPLRELEQADSSIPEEMHDLPWSYAVRILQAARYAACVKGLYPVFITSFKCSPDSFVLEPFREILDNEKKPYLVLQTDDLDSAVGYETRIEAGIRAFRNHLAAEIGAGKRKTDRDISHPDLQRAEKEKGIDRRERGKEASDFTSSKCESAHASRPSSIQSSRMKCPLDFDSGPEIRASNRHYEKEDPFGNKAFISRKQEINTGKEAVAASSAVVNESREWWRSEEIGKQIEEFDAYLETAVSNIWNPVKSLWGQLHALRDKTLLMPCWDRFACELLVEMFKNRGIDARLLKETPELISGAMRHNSGQCLPVSVVAEECIDYVRRENLSPDKTVLWTAKSTWTCNIPMYPSFISRILQSEGMGEIDIYRGTVIFSDIYPMAPVEAYLAYLFGGLLHRFGCMIRPYEDVPGTTDAALDKCLGIFREAFRNQSAKDLALQQAVEVLDGVARTIRKRPKVAIFGDFYVRDNEVFTQDLVRYLERAGAEVVTTPYTEYAKIISSAHFKRLLLHGRIAEWTMLKALLAVMETVENRYRRQIDPSYSAGFSSDSSSSSAADRTDNFGAEQYDSDNFSLTRLFRSIKAGMSFQEDESGKSLSAQNIEAASTEPDILSIPSEEELTETLGMFGMRIEQKGETFENLLKVFHLARQHPDLKLFVQTNPAFCCPALITEAMSEKIEKITGIPVVSITYDGTSAPRNSVVLPYLKHDSKGENVKKAG